MANINFYLTTSLATLTHAPQCLLRITAPTNQRIAVLGVDVGLRDDTPTTSPFEFAWKVISTIETKTDDFTARAQDRSLDETIQGTFVGYNTAGYTEPTYTSVLCYFSLHQQGSMQWRPPFELIVKGGESLGFCYTGSTLDTPVNFTVYCSE